VQEKVGDLIVERSIEGDKYLDLGVGAFASPIVPQATG
jgi:hypothetical protein